MKLYRTLAVATVLAALTVPATAPAEPLTIKDSKPHASRPNKLDIVGGVGFLGNFELGAGVYYSLPLLPDGFIPALNDSFALEFGPRVRQVWAGYFGCDYSYTELAGLAGVRWDFFMNRTWTVFGRLKAGLGYEISDVQCGGFSVPSTGGVTFAADSGVGAYWNFADNMSMRLEVGYPWVNAGISIDM